jgi:pilin isopeptide linkage protein
VSAEPWFVKSLDGRDWQASDQFGFTLTALTPGAPLPAATAVQVGPGQADRFGFGPISFTVPGQWQYEVRETPPAPSLGVTGDPDPALVTITVTDDQAGQLVAAIAYQPDNQFTNVAVPAPPEPPCPPEPPGPPGPPCPPGPPGPPGPTAPSGGQAVAALVLGPASYLLLLLATGLALVGHRRAARSRALRQRVR